MTATTRFDELTLEEKTFFTVVHPLDNAAEERSIQSILARYG